MGGRRVLIDPSLRRGFGVQGLVQEAAGPAPPAPGSLGRLDVVAVTSGEPGSFDLDTVARLDLRRTRFLVPDEGVRKRLALLGHSGVRVVRPGDVVVVGGVRVSVSPARGLLSSAVGFHLDGGSGSTLWHTGPIPPLEVDALAMSFAADHAANVVCAWAAGIALSSSGPPLFADGDDALALARLARARILLPIGRGMVPAGLFSLVFTTTASSPPITTSRDPRIEDPVSGTWYRFRT